MNKRRVLITSLIVIFLTATAVVGWYYYNHKKNDISTKPTSETAESNAVNPNIAPRQENQAEPTPSSSVPKPILVKSAGNVAPAPTNVLIDFTCSAPIGFICQLQLTSTSGQKILFDKQAISTDGRGQSATVWEWKTIPGNWQAQVVLYNSSGQSNNSDVQNFEVK